MQPIRQIFENAPESITVPLELQHRRIELILWPLEEPEQTMRTVRPMFNIAEVEHIEIPSREERNARH